MGKEELILEFCEAVREEWEDNTRSVEFLTPFNDDYIGIVFNHNDLTNRYWISEQEITLSRVPPSELARYLVQKMDRMFYDFMENN